MREGVLSYSAELKLKMGASDTTGVSEIKGGAGLEGTTASELGLSSKGGRLVAKLAWE